MNPSSKIAIVHDDFVQHGGAEKLVECMLEIFPKAELYTSIITEDWRTKLTNQNPNLKIRTSFLDKLPLKIQLYKVFSFLYPIAFYLFDFNNFDLVLSSSARFAHGIRTPKDTYHIAYVNSPGRMIWEPSKYFNKFLLPLIYPLIILLRVWDRYVSVFPDIIIANSNTVKNRIKKYWGRPSKVIYPFFDLKKMPRLDQSQKGHFIVVSRLEKWKRIDLAIKACEITKEKLVIVGTGRYKKQLERMANSNYVEFVGRLDDDDLVNTYLNSKALIITQKEDFGITSVEAQALGVPVIAYKAGGALETVLKEKSGVFFEQQTAKSLADSIKAFREIEIDPQVCIMHADKFSKEKFIKGIIEVTKHGRSK